MPLDSSNVIAQCTEYSIKSFGGTEALVAALVRGLSAHCKIVLVSNDESESIRGSELASHIQKHIRWQPESQTPQKAQELALQLRDLDVNLAHFHFGGNYGWGSRIFAQSPVEFATRRGICCVTTVHSFDSILDGYCGPQRPLWFKLAALPIVWLAKIQLLSRVRAEISISCENYRRLRRWYWPLRSRFRHIYHSRLNIGQSTARADRAKIILNVGSVAFRKGQDVLAQSFARIASRYPDWKLQLIGRVTERACGEEIGAIASRFNLSDRIEMLGDRADAHEFMQRAAIYAQPSRFEGLGLALQEALFYGCACVGSRVGGIPELIDYGANGLLVSSGNVTELAAELERLITDGHLREEFQARAPLSILEKGMTGDQMVAKHLKIYQSVLNEK